MHHKPFQCIKSLLDLFCWTPKVLRLLGFTFLFPLIAPLQQVQERKFCRCGFCLMKWMINRHMRNTQNLFFSLDDKSRAKWKRGGALWTPYFSRQDSSWNSYTAANTGCLSQKRQTTEDRTRACRVELSTLENSIARSQGIGLGSNPEPGNSYWLDLRNVMGQWPLCASCPSASPFPTSVS